MDDTNNNLTNNNQNAGQVAPVVTPVVPPVPPVSLPQKEIAPILSKDKTEELITRSEEEPKILQEVRDAGVEAVSDKPHLTKEDKLVGLDHAKESTPVKTSPSGNIKLPMTEKEALNIIKTTRKSDSRHWFAVLIEKIYKQFRFGNSGS